MFAYLFSRHLYLGLVFLILAGCAENSKDSRSFLNNNFAVLANLKAWSFQGRLGIKGQPVIYINWDHRIEQDSLKLSGPLGQGAKEVSFSDYYIQVKDGVNKIESFGAPDEFIQKKLGIEVPVSHLRYWVIGLPDPNLTYLAEPSGFMQAEWKVEYQRVSVKSGQSLPHKIQFERNNIKLKLFIDQWKINEITN
ncbi:MAG: lipoprotein insertase outer membrane protein LolB [Methylovulum sp.]|jgi:outer membrane lipoprotein LolB|nr:lipoprotein insertase outer membrane protein LolB [Methylovulum sp.]MCF8007737.1 lipoprotein insertase outer membrane protein LolB [Methylovulum sp.]